MIRTMPTFNLIKNFVNLPYNTIIIGPKTMTIAYARPDIPGLTTTHTSKSFQWHNMISVLQEFIKKHATIGAQIDIVHHTHFQFGTVRKDGGSFVPWSVDHPRIPNPLPDDVLINPTDEELRYCDIYNFDLVVDNIKNFMLREVEAQNQLKEQEIAEGLRNRVGRPRIEDIDIENRSDQGPTLLQELVEYHEQDIYEGPITR